MARTKGALNKATTAIREKFQLLLDRYTADEMKADLEALTAKERLDIVAKFAEFVAPKLQRSEVEQTNLGERVIKVVYDKPNGTPSGATPGPGVGDWESREV